MERYIKAEDAKKILSTVLDNTSDVWRRAFDDLTNDFKQILSKWLLFVAVGSSLTSGIAGFVLGWFLSR